MRFLREPLVHFLTIGALLFALYGFVHDRPKPTSDTIAVSAAQISLFQEQWRQQQGRPPTQPELQWLIDQYIREEVLSREAKALGLDRDDTIPEFDTVRTKVKDDFIANQRQEASESAYQHLRERYKIVIAPMSETSRVALSQGIKP